MSKTRRLVTLLGSFAALCLLVVSTRGDAWQPLTLGQLQRMSATELELLYRSAEVGTPPVGKAKGKVLLVTTAHMPKLRARMQNVAWKGKTIAADGSFQNRWIGGLEWIGSEYVIGPSWIDGQPTVVIDYAPGTPLFGNTRDELREVAPGLYLGPLYDLRKCPSFKGWIALEISTCCR